MTIEITTLANGLRVVTHRMAHLETASLGVWVAAGSRHETPALSGISHFLEHMAFMGTGTRSAQAIAEEIEQVGGDLNAATSLEMTAYYARVLKGDIALGLEILADILLNPRYDEGDIEREREVILQEIAATRDSPDETVMDLAQEAAFPDQPVGRPILGTPKSVKAFSEGDLRRFLGEWYLPERLVVAAAGGVEHGHVVRHVEALFGGLSRGRAAGIVPARYVGGQKSSVKAFEQSHLVLALEGPSYRDSRYYAAQIFSGLLGGGMSSRLFQEIRERRGLCYSIYSSCWGLEDAGLFTIHAAAGRESMRELIEVTCAEIQRAAREPIASREVERAKAQLKAGLLMSLESSSARAEQMARQLLVFDRLMPTEEIVARIEGVGVAAVEAIAASLVAARPSVVVAGVGREAKRHLASVETLLRAA